MLKYISHCALFVLVMVIDIFTKNKNDLNKNKYIGWSLSLHSAFPAHPPDVTLVPMSAVNIRSGEKLSAPQDAVIS